MPLIKWDPFEDFLTLDEEISDFFGKGWRLPALRRGRLARWAPTTDIAETENEVIIKTELPGLKAKDVEVTLDKDVLTIKGERKFSEEVKRENYHRIERRYGSFKRSFTLPSNVDLGSVKAGVKDGLLIVKIAKIEAPKPKVIEVEVEESKAKKIEAEEG